MLKDQNSLRDGFMPEKNDLKTSGTKLELVHVSLRRYLLLRTPCPPGQH